MPAALTPCQDVIFNAQTTTYTGTAGTLTGWQYGPTKVLVWTTTDAYVKVGNGVTATTGSTPIPAYTPVEINIPAPAGAGASLWTVSAIQIASGGSVYAKPMQD